MGDIRDTDTGTNANTRLPKFVTVLAGLLVAHVVVSNHRPIAKLILWVSGRNLTAANVSEMTLNVIFVFACVSICIGMFAAKRWWMSYEQIMVALWTAILVAAMFVVDHNLKIEKGDAELHLTDKWYYIGWIIVLWVSPFILMRPECPSHERIQPVGSMVCVSVAMCLAGFVLGFAIEEIIGRLVDFWLCGIEISQSFWIARPVTTNALACAYVVVGFSSIWWRGFWRSVASAQMWTVGIVVCVVIYAGVYGSHIRDSSVAWQSFVAFSTFPVAVAVTILGVYGITRQGCKVHKIGWPVSRWFWWLMSLGFAVSFALIAYCGLAPLDQNVVENNTWTFALVVLHGLNGIALCLTFRFIMPLFLRLIPDEQRPVDAGIAQ